MRKQEEKLIITFRTTADAIGAEQLCRLAGLPGRMIPVPRELSAGCGLAWCTAPEQEQMAKEHFTESGLEWEAMTRLFY